MTRNVAGGTLDGSGKSPLGIAPEQMTKEVWDFIFLDTDVCSTVAISAWCPVVHRCLTSFTRVWDQARFELFNSVEVRCLSHPITALHFGPLARRAFPSPSAV
jgi:hypothetical protein